MQSGFKKVSIGGRVDADSPKIVIVGAGLSGISAAAKLIENGLEDVVVLEAENRIGGRVYSTNFAGGVVDLGAQYVHGEKGNAIYELVNPHSELKMLKNNESDFDYFRSNGETVSREIGYAIDKKLSKFMKNVPESRNISLGSFMEEISRDDLLGSQSDDEELIAESISLYKKQAKLNFATSSLSDVSTFNKRYYQQCEGNQMIFWRDGTFSKVFDYITVNQSFRFALIIWLTFNIIRKSFPIHQRTLTLKVKFN